MATVKEVIYGLYSQRKSYKEIALAIGSNASAVAARVNKYRKKEPDKWPRLKRYTEPMSLKIEVYRCSDCEIIFGVEHTDDLHDVTCPYCWQQERLIENGFSFIKVKDVH